MTRGLMLSSTAVPHLAKSLRFLRNETLPNPKEKIQRNPDGLFSRSSTILLVCGNVFDLSKYHWCVFPCQTNKAEINKHAEVMAC